MLTAFGKFCRKLRIDNGHITKVMADKLKVTPAYLSAVELGKRAIPKDWKEKIVTLYNLDSATASELENAIIHSSSEVRIDLTDANETQKNAAVMFARKLDDLDTKSLKKILAIVNNSRDK